MFTTLAVMRSCCVAAVVQFHAPPAPLVCEPPLTAALGDKFPPMVVPVSRDVAPYSLELVWRALTAGDTTPPAFRARYPGRACENTDFFLRREHAAVQPCRALVLAPWLEMVGSMPDSILAGRVALFADSTGDLALVADSAGGVNALVAAVAGDRGPPRLVAVNYAARRASRAVMVRAVVLVSLATQPEELSEEQLIVALPYVMGLPPQVLFRDQRGTLHLHPGAFREQASPSREVLVGPKTLTLDTEVHSCGSISCVVPYPLYFARLRLSTPQRELYLSVRYGEGVLIQMVRPIADLINQKADSVVSGEWTLVTSASATTILTVSPQAQIRVGWRGNVAVVDVPRLP